MNHLLAALALMPNGPSLARLLRRNPIPRNLRVLSGQLSTPAAPAPTASVIHTASGAIGDARPIMVHCAFCSTGRAKRKGDGRYHCNPSRAGCDVTFTATGFEFDASRPRPGPGRWALLGWDLAEGRFGTWVYEVA